ncbi:MAG: hypothetical protein ACOYVG_11155 [Bacteroidota bacterium]
MSDKSFEQQVREELSDLRIKPNAAVWESVATSLKKERKRRWVLWMFFLLAGLSVTALWWMIQEQPAASQLSHDTQITGTKKSTDQTISLSEKNETPVSVVTQKEASIKQKIEKGNIENLPSSTTGFSTGKIKSATVYQQPIRNTVNESDTKSNQLNQIIGQDLKKDEKISQSSITVENVNMVDGRANRQSVQSENQEKADISSVVKTVDIKKDSVEIVKETELLKPASTDSSVSKNSKTIKANKWQWRIGFNAGTSGVRNSIRSLLENINSRAYDNAFSGNSAPITGSPGPGGGSSGAMPNMKPVVRDALSFGTFLEAIRKFGKKEKHAIGLTAGYHLFSTRTGVGSLNTGTVQFSNVNTTNDANKYYGVKDSASYTSYYHFIQLGLRYYQSLKWFKEVDMQWYAGIGVNALLGSNGLHLGSMNTNTYLFQNRSLLRTMQMDITGGIDFGLGKSKQVYIGPQMQYMLSNLSKQPGVNQHLFRPSVRLSFVLNKRK